jgi:inosine-uridine nucleoside N-ribohydrolase
MTKRWVAGIAAVLLMATTAGRVVAQAAVKAEPVILDTDIGDDIDDAFALGLILTSPELKLLGVTTAFGDTELRARLAERYLAAAGRGDVPVLAGVKTEAKNVFSQRVYAERGPQAAHGDAVDFLLRKAKEQPGEITLIAIGALTNVKAAIARDPDGFRRLKRVVLMGGSVDRGYDGDKGERRPADAEWNFVCDPAGAQALLASGVPVFVMPLDSTQIRLPAAEAKRIYAHGSAVTDQITLLYHQWATQFAADLPNPTLYDPVAVTYAFRPELCPAEPMRLEIDAKGFSRRVEGKPNAQVCLVADEAGFLKLLEERLTSAGKR